MEKPEVFEFLGLRFNTSNILGGTLVAVIVLLMCIWLARKVELRPNKKQNVLEYMIDFTNDIVKSNVEDEAAQKHLSLYAFVLFLFIWWLNQLGLFLEVKDFNGLMLLKSPTADPAITMTMAMMTLLLSYNFGVQKFGSLGYFKNYGRPMLLFIPINILEEFTNFLTLSLRLYGNIYAGEVLLTLIGDKFAHSFGIPTIILSAPLTLIWQGFSVFIGSIQAYVFVTLSMVYIGKKVTQE
ncbi:F0F1 ATP synthase subunit A [Lactobacillus psittaci]|uniref:ATP synthase subunit a n=1 Tax=Lactobacillus psittaci DSM 15354 TaxID=1122152 RepID=A0A0R1S366_9LACO|nr:F0F1 ATP synthase subunit A [Lactobacillus psittaci]KRL63436.1 ATP synthase F0, A subunit [Lactobacillus psittaci DSM 15354]